MWQHIISQNLGKPQIFEGIVNTIKNLPSKNTKEVRHSTQRKGDIFENICVQILQLKGYEKICLLKDVPQELLETLGLKKRDVGIDIVAFRNHLPVAIQCKFRSKKTVTWREISTFEALCARTGPWAQHIIMTNANYIRREGTRTSKDVSFMFRQFQEIHRHEWSEICGFGKGRTLSENDAVNPLYETYDTNDTNTENKEEKESETTLEVMRKKRLEKFHV